MANTVHHPSCPERTNIGNPAYCGNWPRLDHAVCASSVECLAVTVAMLEARCICPPPELAELDHADAAAMGFGDAWTPSQLPGRTEDQMILDIHHHAAVAREGYAGGHR